jgi:hypothetical protein
MGGGVAGVGGRGSDEKGSGLERFCQLIFRFERARCSMKAAGV